MHRRNFRGAIQAAFAAALLAVFWPAAGDAMERVALVVGNGGYDPQHIPPLPNPTNDAQLMAGALEAVGFQVRLVTDADIATMRTEIEGFGKRLRRAGGDAVGLFYYAGHGVESRGSNYLIPIGAEIDSAVEFEIDAVPARWVLSFMEAAGNRLNMVILDACRNNPYATGRGAPRGLASMDAPSGSLIAYSAAPGQASTDGAGDNSPYTVALASWLAEPGLKLEDVFKRVRVQVERKTGGEQTPWENSSLRGDFYFVAPVGTESPTVLPSPTLRQLAGQAYEAAERTNTVGAFRLVAERFPDTFYAALAKEQIAKLKRASTVEEPAPGRMLSWVAPSGDFKFEDIAIVARKSGRTYTMQIETSMKAVDEKYFGTATKLHFYALRWQGNEWKYAKYERDVFGSWRIGDKIRASVSVPSQFLDESLYTELRFCVYSTRKKGKICYPSPNLVDGMKN